MKISELSKSTGVSQRMLRYFEKIGLLEPLRAENAYRDYDENDKARILEIRGWQRLGLSLKEISDLLSRPAQAEEILGPVFQRERDIFHERQRALQDLRERFTRKKLPVFETRVAHSIPGLDRVVDALEGRGWNCRGCDYFRFGERQDLRTTRVFAVAELIWQSSLGLLVCDREEDRPALFHFLRDFCREAQRVWPQFDGHPPRAIDPRDCIEFFAFHDVVADLQFTSKTENTRVEICLPYAALFALAKSTETSTPSRENPSQN